MWDFINWIYNHCSDFIGWIHNCFSGLFGESVGLILLCIISFVGMFVVIANLIALFCIFDKAGRTPWLILVPFYGRYVFCHIATGVEWFSILYCLNFFVGIINGNLAILIDLASYIILNINLAKRFGKKSGFAIGLILLPLIFYPILAFDKSKYIPVGQEKNNNDDSDSEQNQKQNDYDEFNDSTQDQEINFSSNNNNKDNESED